MYWLEWKMVQAPSGFWMNKENCRRYILWLTSKLRYKSFNDWYLLSHRHFEENNGWIYIDEYLIHTRYMNILSNNFDEVIWDKTDFKSTRYSKISMNGLRSIEEKDNIIIEHGKNIGEHTIIAKSRL